MAVRILEKNGIDNTNIDGAGFNKFSAGGYSGVIKGILNELLITNTTSVVTLNTGELLVNGFRLVVNEPISFSLGVVPSEVTKYRVVVEVVVDSNSEVTTRFFIQQASINLAQNNFFATETGAGTYQLSLATFDYSSDGIENLVTDFKILDNDYKTYVDNLLAKKVGVEPQQFSEAEKRQARENIGAVSTAQLEDNVKYVYIVGSTPLDNNWFSDSPSGTPITPENEIIYIVRTEGEFYNNQYIFNSSTNEYEMTGGAGSSQLEVVEVEGVISYYSDMTPEYTITFTLPSDFDLTSVKEYLFKLTTQGSWVGATNAWVFITKGNTPINILTPYNSDVSYATLGDLAQVFNNSNGWEFKGIMQSNGLLVEMDNLTSVRAEIGNIDTLLTTLNSGGGV